MAALDTATSVLAQAGDNIVASTDMYGGTASYFTNMASRRGIELRTVSTEDLTAFQDAIDEQTAFVHLETVANPSLKTPDFAPIADIAHERRTPVVVDNTFATPYLCRPIEHGADIIWESTTKWLHGKGTTVGGVLVDGGTFPWRRSGYDELDGNNPAFDIDFVSRFGEAAFANVARHRGVRSLGNQQSPFDAWQTLQGIETLGLRMQRHCKNATQIAEALKDHPSISWVSYPGFESHPTHDMATKYLEPADRSHDGFGGMITFGPEGGYEAAKRICEETQLSSFLANIGDAKSVLIHPASTTHAQLSTSEQRAAGVSPDMVRLSVGLETATDIVADLSQAIAAWAS
jgi:O-acetylhomoserine (thiol)-lyase